MPTKKQIITIYILCVIALGLGYWSCMPEKGSGQRAEVVAPQPTPTTAYEKLIAIEDQIVDEAIRKRLKKPEGELTEADLEKVTRLGFSTYNQITHAGLKDVVKLQNLKWLSLSGPQIHNSGLKEVAKLRNLEYLQLRHTQITDAGLKEVAKLQKLTELRLPSLITDEGLKEVAKLQKLGRLVLMGTQITDEGLKEVSKLQNLEGLWLNSTQITDAGLKEVAKLQKLKLLYLHDTKVTEAGVAELKKALPNCTIVGP